MQNYLRHHLISISILKEEIDMRNFILSTSFVLSKEVTIEIQGYILKLNDDLGNSKPGLLPATFDNHHISMFFAGIIIITCCLVVIVYKYKRKEEKSR